MLSIIFLHTRRAPLNFNEFIYTDLVIKSSGEDDLLLFLSECQEKARRLQLENFVMVTLIQGKGKRIMSLPSGYMRTDHLAGLIKKMKNTAECEDLGRYLYTTSPS